MNNKDKGITYLIIGVFFGTVYSIGRATLLPSETTGYSVFILRIIDILIVTPIVIVFFIGVFFLLESIMKDEGGTRNNERIELALFDYSITKIIHPTMRNTAEKSLELIEDIRKLGNYGRVTAYIEEIPKPLRTLETTDLNELFKFLDGFSEVEKFCDEDTIIKFVKKLKNVNLGLERTRNNIAENKIMLLDVTAEVTTQILGMDELEQAFAELFSRKIA